MDYSVSKDLLSIREILGMTQSELASAIDVEQVTISRNESGITAASNRFLEKLYAYAFERGIRMNRLKEMFWKESLEANHKLLFHGAKTQIDGTIDRRHGRANNDFGQGFYAGESYNQAISFVSGFERSSVYFLDFEEAGLKCQKYGVDQRWMMTIAYHRGTLSDYREHPIIQQAVEESANCDYIIAPIADNRMFQIIDTFINGEITDEQCKHCLAATNLGKQYVLLSDKAIAHAKIVERCYLSSNEKDHYKNLRNSDTKLGDDKVKLARIQYRGQGRYIDEILKR